MAGPYYTTATICKDRIKAFDSGLTDAKIETIIEMVEGIINAVMRTSYTATFDSTKHGLIRDVATNLTAFYMLTYDVTEYGSSSAAALTADLLWSTGDRGLAILADRRTLKYLAGL